MKEAGDLAIRLMAAPDISAGMRLRELAGWNQTEEDWRRFLEFEPDGCFVALQNGRVCGTAATLAYERRFGWSVWCSWTRTIAGWESGRASSSGESSTSRAPGSKQ